MSSTKGMQKTVVLDVVGLSRSVMGAHMPFLQNYCRERSITSIKPMLPAVTTSAQSTYITGKWPTEHGIVGNGWYDREDAEVKFWKQSNHLVKADKIWDRAKAQWPDFTCAKLFWWYNMYSSADYSITPRPQYHADGVKQPDCYTYPAQLRDELQAELGTFPLFDFWGPKTSIRSTQWIADASIWVDRRYDPTLSLIYLPHLDYCLQKIGPVQEAIATELRELDRVIEQLITYYLGVGASVILLSEYGINPVRRPVHLNRILRQEGWLAVRNERWYELLDAGASRAFALADHQIAHVYLNDPALLPVVKKRLETVPGVKLVLDETGKRTHGLAHERSGDLVVVAEDDSWFTYYYWLDDEKAPDFARMVDIHRKPGYDPVELFFDPANPLIKLKAAYKLARKWVGFRYRMDVIPLDAGLIKGSHGSSFVAKEYYPVCITDQPLGTDELLATEVYNLIWNSLVGQKNSPTSA